MSGSSVQSRFLLQRFQHSAVLLAAQSIQGLLLDLPYSLARQIQLRPDVLQSSLPLAIEPKAELENKLFALGQTTQNLMNLVSSRRLAHRCVRSFLFFIGQDIQ